MPRRTTEEKIAHYQRHGQCPVDIDHLPEAIQKALRHLRIAPLMKECFANCQKLVFHNQHLETALDLEYHEGYAVGLIPFEHAWLVFEGELVDLTIGPDRAYPIEYRDSYTYSVQQVRDNVLETKMWTSLTSPRDFAKIHPLMVQDTDD